MPTSVTSVTSHFPKPQNGFTTTLASTIVHGAAVVPLSSTGSYANGDTVVLVIEPTSATSKEVFTGIIDTAGVQVTSVVWTVVQGTNPNHSGGVTIVDYTTATHIAMISKGALVSHNADGTMKTALPLTSPLLTTPKIITSANDTNGNEIFKVGATAAAVNEITLTNAATGNAAQIAGSGDDANVSVYATGKGTGGYFLPRLPYYQTALSITTFNAEAIAGTLNIPAFPVAVVVLLTGYDTPALGTAAPTQLFACAIRADNLTGTVLAAGQQNKDAANGVSSTNTITLSVVATVAANTAKTFVFTQNTTASNIVASGSFSAVVWAQ